MSPEALTDARFNRIVEELYAGTLDDDAWDRAIRDIADLVHAAGAVLFAVDPGTGVVFRSEAHRLDPAVIEQYHSYWCPGDPKAGAGLILLPNDIPYFMPAWLHKSASKIVTLSFQRPRSSGPFERADVEAYQRIIPHITRALEIRDRLERAQAATETLADRLAASLTFGVVVLDAEGRMLQANPVAQEIAADGGYIRCRRGERLRLRGAAGAKLARLIAAGAPTAGGPEGLLHIQRPRGPALSVVITSLPKNNVAWIGVEPRWLVLLFDPERRLRINAELIARDLGISASEAVVAAMIGAGASTGDIARRRGVNEATVRAQLKSIFRKTMIRSQSELVRRIALGPALHA